MTLFAFADSPSMLMWVDVAIKATLLLAIGWGVSLTLSLCRSSAATRHQAWCLAIAGSLALPILTIVLPQWNIPVTWQRAAAPSTLVANAPTAQTTGVEPLQPWTVVGQVAAAPAVGVPVENRAELPGFTSTSTAIAADSAPRVATWNWLFWMWMTGAGLALMPTIVGLLSLRRLESLSYPSTDERLLSALQQMLDRLQMTGTVRLLQTQARSMPMVWGLWRPTVLLPDDANGWSSDRLQVVLLHELAHVQRLDCLTQILGQLARAVYWFNPLAWLALRRLQIEQEQACDDSVLRHGFQGPDYAEHLLAVSVGYRSATRSALALAMATPSKIERRVRSILDPSRNRQPLSRRRLGIATVTALALFSSLAAAHLESAETGAEGQATTIAKDQPAAPRVEDAAANASRLSALRAKIAEQYVTPVDDQAIFQGAIKGMVGALRDPYSDYLTAEMLAEMDRQIAGQLVGIGAQLERHETAIRVVTPLPDSPALKAGVQPGDVILQIDGKPAAGLDLPGAVKLIAGAEGTVVRLKLGRAAGQQVNLEVTRGRVVLPTVKGSHRGPDNHWVYLLDDGRKIGYAQVALFGAATPQELRDVLTPLIAQGLKGLVLDLRFCPGGSLDSAVSVAKLFLSQGTIVSLHGRDAETTISADGSPTLGDFPLIVLVNEQTASAGEIVAGALQDHRRAVVLGTRTFGKGSVQSLIKLDDTGGALKLTTSSYRLPKGRNIDRREGATAWGVDPDDGFFVPLDRARTNALLQQRKERDIVKIQPAQTPAAPKAVEPPAPDPQLAAALNALAARLTDGQFSKVNNVTRVQMEQHLKRDDLQRRRESLLKDLEPLDRELAELEQALR